MNFYQIDSDENYLRAGVDIISREEVQYEKESSRSLCLNVF